MTDALAADGMPRHHFGVLLALSERGTASQAELGRRLSIDPSDMTAAVADLERGVLVSRLLTTATGAATPCG